MKTICKFSKNMSVNDAIRDFNNLDVAGTEGNQKQFIILCEKGREGWNCRSLFSVALFRSPKSRVFVLQATMRCLRKITDEQQTAMVYLSKENYDILNDELNNNFRMEIKDMKDPSASKKQRYQVRVVPPPKYITVKAIKHIYSLEDDDLAEWAKHHKEAFIPLDPTIQANVTAILKTYPTMIQIKSTGNSNGDPFLVATAKVKGGCIITDERPGDVKSKNYRIPNVCNELGIRYINLHEFLDLILD